MTNQNKTATTTAAATTAEAATAAATTSAATAATATATAAATAIAWVHSPWPFDVLRRSCDRPEFNFARGHSGAMDWGSAEPITFKDEQLPCMERAFVEASSGMVLWRFCCAYAALQVESL